MGLQSAIGILVLISQNVLVEIFQKVKSPTQLLLFTITLLYCYIVTYRFHENDKLKR